MKTLEVAAGRTRSDALRNHRHLLDVAQVVIAEQGTNASLRDIARRAEVGLGTLYRNFPTRGALLEALLRDGFDRLANFAIVLERSTSPLDGLRTWLKEFVKNAAIYRGLSSSMMTTLGDEDSALHSSCLRMRNAGGRLLKLAQTSGDIRSDVTSNDIFALINAIAWIAEQSAGFAERKEHLFALTMDAIEPQVKPSPRKHPSHSKSIPLPSKGTKRTRRDG